jgi:hypothetical protein
MKGTKICIRKIVLIFVFGKIQLSERKKLISQQTPGNFSIHEKRAKKPTRKK